LEGSIMFFLTAILILSFFNSIFNAVFIAFFLTNVELVSKNYDNLTLPLFSVFIMSLI
jgi:dolichol kinase